MEELCNILAVSASGYYKHLSNRQKTEVSRYRQERNVQAYKVKEIFMDYNERVGARTILKLMKREGYKIGIYRVRMLMREQNLRCLIRSKRRLSKRIASDHLFYENILGKTQVERKGQAWVIDITYIMTQAAGYIHVRY